MPFDGKNYNTPALNRARLIDALRNTSQDFWFFPSFLHCACGLAVKIGLIERLDENAHFTIRSMAGALGMPFEQARRLFTECGAYGVTAGFEVTPAMVADALEGLASPPNVV